MSLCRWKIISFFPLCSQFSNASMYGLCPTYLRFETITTTLNFSFFLLLLKILLLSTFFGTLCPCCCPPSASPGCSTLQGRLLCGRGTGPSGRTPTHHCSGAFSCLQQPEHRITTQLLGRATSEQLKYNNQCKPRAPHEHKELCC